ncbi:MAG: CPBP family intramembrane metalloprotease [Clostridia bacterium]|nr:CPBP family intramembrane metalloprotease [Clostridia bacterium]
MKKRNLTIFDAGIAFVLAFVLAQFTSAIGVSITKFIMQAIGKTNEQISIFFDTAWGYLLQALFMNIAFVLVFIWYRRHINKHELLAKPNSNTAKYILKAVIIGVVSMFLLSGVLNYFQSLVDKLGFTSSSLPYQLNSPKNYIISLISLAVIPAVCEELIFRGVLVNALKGKGYTFAIIFSSIMFSIFHFSPSQLIYPICFGLILSIVYLRTNNIFVPMLLHFINNALSLSIQYFSNGSAEAFTHSASMLIYAIITLLIWVVIMVYMFKDFKAHTSSQASNSNNDTQSTNSQLSSETSTDASSAQNTVTTRNQKLNNWVFYGSLAIMICVYILLLSV